MMEWKEVRLGDVAVLSTGFPFKGDLYSSEGIRVVRGDNVTIGELRWTKDKDKRWKEPFDRKAEFSLQEADIVIGMDGSRVGYNRAQIKQSDLPLLIAQRVACVRNNEKSLQSFLYYQIFSNQFIRYIRNIQTGSAIPHVSLKQIGDFKFLLPPLSDQRRIASILSSLDDKIAVNRRICENLEAQAQALFKNWFVDFAPFKDGKFVESELGMIPEGWRVGRLSEVASFISRGLSPKYDTTTDEWVLGQTCVRNNIVTLNNARTHLPKKKNEKWVKQWDILINSTGMGSLGRVGIVYFDKNNVALDSHLTVVRVDNQQLRHYIGRNLLSRQGEIENMAVGSTGQTELPRDSVKGMRIIIPNVDDIEPFNKTIEAIALKIYSLLIENQQLASLRDTLLPKLMSGEIKI